jgi:hypothetical protein
MLTAQYLIVCAAAFAAGLTLGPIIGRAARQRIAVGGIVALLAGAALVWPRSRALLVGARIFELPGFESLGLDVLGTGLFGIAAVLLFLAFGAAVTGT